MSESDPTDPTGTADTADKATTSIRRFRIGLNVAVQIVLGLFILGAVNFLSCRHYVQWDRTPTKSYTLSEQTRNILDSLTKEVELTVLFRRDADVFGYTKRVLELYKEAGKGKLHYRLVDPERDPAAISELRNENSKLLFDDKMILVDAEGGVQQVLKDEDMFDREPSTFLDESTAVRGRVVKYRLESALSSAILAAAEARQQVVYVVVDKGGFRRVETPNVKGDAFGVLQTLGGERSMVVKPLYLSSQEPIPGDASAVVLMAPKQELTGRELKKLFQDYWQRLNGGVVILSEPAYLSEQTNLARYLKTYYGIVLEDDRFLTVKSEGGQNMKLFETVVTFSPESPVTRDLRDRTTVLPRETHSISLLQSSDDPLLPRDLHHRPLMFAGVDFWKEKDYRDESVLLEPEKKEDLDPFVAVSLERGAGMNQELRLDSSRMVVVGNGGLVDPDAMTRESVGFILSSLNWVSDRDHLVGGIQAKAVERFRVRVADSEYAKLEWLSVRILPGSVFLLGCFIAFMRRR